MKKLQDLAADQLLRAATESGAMGARPVVDGATLPAHPFDPAATDISATVPIMVGITKDEATLFLAADPKFGKFTETDLMERAKAVAKERADAAIKLYKKLYPKESPTYLVADIQTQAGAWMSSVTLAERNFAQGKAPVYMYVQAHHSPFEGGILRAHHGSDLPYMFDRIDSAPNITGKTPEARALGDRMSRAWMAFARTGNPDHPGIPHWPAYDPTTRATIFFDTKSTIVNDPWREQRQCWQSVRSASAP